MLCHAHPATAGALHHLTVRGINKYPRRPMRCVINASALLFLWSLVIFSFPSFVLSFEISPAAKSEIQHLLVYIEQSGCEFYRNGSWHQNTKAVREHVELKYDYFMKKGQVKSTEDFIKWSASKSELSGKQYMVKCGSESPLFLAQWLSDELNRYREKNK